MTAGRTRLPDRRPSTTETVEAVLCGTAQTWTVTFGFDANGHVKEVFADGAKNGSALEATVDDACVLISLVLQFGVEPAHLRGRCCRQRPDGPPDSVIGAICDRLTTVEVRDGPGVAALYGGVDG